MSQVMILSGVSGSGKSAAAELLRPPKYRDGAAMHVVSADHYFLVDGQYRFDAAKLSDAHAACFRAFIDAMQAGVDLIIVDNTNTTTDEISPYCLGAGAFGYSSEIITVMCRNDDDVKVAAARNRHGVTLDVVMGQHRRIQSRRLKPWWCSKVVPMATSAE